MFKKKKDHLFLRCCIFTAALIFCCFLLIELEILSLIIESDRSNISLIIIMLYLGSSIHWFFLAWKLGKESEILSLDKNTSKDQELNKINLYLKGLERSNFTEKQERLNVLADELSNRHSFGYMAVDVLLKLGLTGTVIGFILMLLPIGEIKEFDPQILQQLLATMSGGMAIALYTTLTGLLTSMLLKFQYFLLDSGVINIINHLSGYLHEESQ
jgi:biopolymer transport protein ExbB/TolQ|tara:strand:- start:12591 stop:13232 length:642 start_codon:yes stop_codon:yes gene_type:complete